MTNAQNATYHAIKEIISGMPLEISEPEPLHEGQYASVVFEVNDDHHSDHPMTFLIEAGGCLARVYA